MTPKKLDFTKSLSGADEAFDAFLGDGIVAESAINIPIEKLHDYPDQPFKPYNEAKLAELVKDIEQNGILSPLLVRQLADGYQILAGHNRKNAGKLAGLEQLPCIIKQVDDAQAVLIVVNTNLNQRDELLPSEKAFAYKMQLDAMKKQGKRNDLTSAQVGRRLESREILAMQVGESRNTISRYIRLTLLLPDLLEMVDKKSIPFMAGDNLSHLTKERQEILLTFLDAHKINTISMAQSKEIKELEYLSEDELCNIFGLTQKPPKAPVIIGKETKRFIETKFRDQETADDKSVAEYLATAVAFYEAHKDELK